MSLYYPFGLLGLIGIPVLIVIYIIKSKYTEQQVSSTYLWELSERFLKKRKRVSKLTGIISLILQILVVAAASLLIAHPVFTIPNAADDYYFILDGSASMNMTDGGETRFERAQREITSIIDSSYNGSTYSLVFVGENTDVMFEGVIKKEQAEKNVNALSASWCEADCASALEFAQEYFNSNPSAKIYVLSDKEISTENMQLIDVSAGENNFAICEYSKPEEVSGGLRATGKVISYRTDETLTVEMWVAQSAVSELKKVGETSVTVTAGEAAEFVVEAAVESYGCVQLKIAELDGMAEDNAVTLYDAALAQSRKVLLVDGAGDGSYIQRAINQVGNATLEYVQADFYDYSTVQAEGYGLYIFNGYVPETLPVNAAVWLVDAIDGTLSGAGPTFRQYEEPRDLTGPNSYYKTKYSEGTSAQERLLLQNIPVSVIKDGKGEENRTVVRKYAQYTV
ncbi:MAG: BatA and WFA domain-containing protein, partial [Clostridia bacterium]|nr:BatA and WFA domain-containing protein [Clostridia bacterium]